MIKALARLSGAIRPPKLEQKASAAAGVIVAGLRPAVWMDNGYSSFARQYCRNGTVFGAIYKISTVCAAIPLLVYRQHADGREEIESGPLVDLLQQPNPQQAGSQFTRDTIAYYKLAGNAYIEAVPNGRGRPGELYTHRPDRVSVLPGDTLNPIRGYEYRVNGQTHTWAADRIRHWKSFHPLDDWYGMSCLQAAGMSITAHNAGHEWNGSLLRNGSQPSLLISTKESLTETQAQRLQRQIDENWSGGANAGRPLLVENASVEVATFGLKPVDMQWLEGLNMAAAEITSAIGVPPELMGIHNGPKRSTYAEARKSFYQETILPLMDNYCEELTAFLAPHFGPDLFITYDQDAIPALTKDRNALWERLGATNFLTINEKRHAAGEYWGATTSIRQGVHRVVVQRPESRVLLGGDVGVGIAQDIPSGLAYSLTGSATFTYVRQIGASWAIVVPVRALYVNGGWNFVPQVGVVFRP